MYVCNKIIIVPFSTSTHMVDSRSLTVHKRNMNFFPITISTVHPLACLQEVEGNYLGIV